MATLDPEFDRRLRALLTGAQEAGFAPVVTDGFRSADGQRRAIDSVSRNVNGRPASVIDYARGIPGYAAPVGASMHQQGMAADLSGTGMEWIRANAPAYGVRFPQSLRGTDPNHSEIDKNFWGPVQDPRDRQAVMERPMPPAEIPASKGGIGPEAAPSPVTQVMRSTYGRPGPVALAPAAVPQAPVPQVAGYAARTPAPAEQESGGLLSGIANFATRTMQNPLFNAGAAMVNAGSRGIGLGGGFMAAGQGMAEAAKREAETRKLEREQDAERNRARLWNDMMTQQQPTWAKDLPPGSVDLARALGPDVGSKLAIDLVTKHAAGWLDRAKLEETKRDHDIKARMAEAQFLEAQNMNNERRDVMRSQTEMRQQQMQDARDAARRRAELMGEEPPAAAPAAPPRPAPVPLPPNPNIRRQSMDAEDAATGDPMLIQAQAAGAPVVPSAPAGGQPQAAPTPPGMIQTPRGPMTPEQARGWGQRLLMDQETRPLGQQILKQVGEADERSRLTNGAQTEADKTLVSAVGSLDRVVELAKQFDPKFLRVPYRAQQALTGVYAKFSELKPEQEADHTRYVQFRADAVRHVNTLLKEISGAAVTQQEFDRILKAEPNAGVGGWLDVMSADNPVEFKAKLEASVAFSKKAIARANFLRNTRGFDPDQIAAMAKAGTLGQVMGLQDVDTVMRRMSNDLNQRFRRENPRESEEDRLNRVRAQLKGVFGI